MQCFTPFPWMGKVIKCTCDLIVFKGFRLNLKLLWKWHQQIGLSLSVQGWSPVKPVMSAYVEQKCAWCSFLLGGLKTSTHALCILCQLPKKYNRHLWPLGWSVVHDHLGNQWQSTAFSALVFCPLWRRKKTHGLPCVLSNTGLFMISEIHNVSLSYRNL